jgi:hypothetical protein
LQRSKIPCSKIINVNSLLNKEKQRKLKIHALEGRCCRINLGFFSLNLQITKYIVHSQYAGWILWHYFLDFVHSLLFLKEHVLENGCFHPQALWWSTSWSQTQLSGHPTTTLPEVGKKSGFPRWRKAVSLKVGARSYLPNCRFGQDVGSYFLLLHEQCWIAPIKHKMGIVLISSKLDCEWNLHMEDMKRMLAILSCWHSKFAFNFAVMTMAEHIYLYGWQIRKFCVKW